MITTNAFNYINVLTKAADASWFREETITNNLANVDTPGYKRKDVDFESVLRQQLRDYKYTSLDQKIDAANKNLDRLNAYAYVDSANYSYREDGNNVDVDTENVELASEKIRYDALTDSLNYEMSRLKSAMS